MQGGICSFDFFHYAPRNPERTKERKKEGRKEGSKEERKKGRKKETQKRTKLTPLLSFGEEASQSKTI